MDNYDAARLLWAAGNAARDRGETWGSIGPARRQATQEFVRAARVTGCTPAQAHEAYMSYLRKLDPPCEPGDPLLGPVVIDGPHEEDDINDRIALALVRELIEMGEL